MSIDLKGLNLVIQEHNALSSKTSLTKQELRRVDFLMAAASAIKAGSTLADLDIERHNTEVRRQGFPTLNVKKSGLTQDQEAEARGWAEFIKNSPEQRGYE